MKLWAFIILDMEEIRPATPDDAAQIAEIYAPYVLNTAISFEETPPTQDEMSERTIKTTATHPWLVAVVDGVVRGYAYAGFHRPRPAYRWSAEVTVYIEEGFHGRGLGKRLYQELFLELSRRGFVRIFAGIALPNPGSERLHEALGFERIGVFPGIGYKLGKWHDVAWYFYHLGNPDAPPPKIPSRFPGRHLPKISHIFGTRLDIHRLHLHKSRRRCSKGRNPPIDGLMRPVSLGGYE